MSDESKIERERGRQTGRQRKREKENALLVIVNILQFSPLQLDYC